MSINPKDVLNKNKNLNKRIGVDKINVDGISIDDLEFNGKNYDNYINLQSLLENVSFSLLRQVVMIGELRLWLLIVQIRVIYYFLK